MTAKARNIAILPIWLAVIGCSPDPRDLHIGQEAKSFDGMLTAAYLQDTGGSATVGTGQDVYVFTGKLPTRYSDRVFSDECVNDVHVSWVGPRTLKIEYGARSGHKPTSKPGPWWTFGRVPHGLTIQLVPHLSNGTYCETAP